MKKILLLLYFIFIPSHNNYEIITYINSVTESTVKVEVKKVCTTIKLIYATIYRVDKNQCWNNPIITADGTVIDTVKLNRDEIKYIAVSQDMLKRNGGIFSYGDSVYLNIPNAPSFTGKYTVHDCMNKRYKKSVDILTGVRKQGNLWRNATITKL